MRSREFKDKLQIKYKKSSRSRVDEVTVLDGTSLKSPRGSGVEVLD